MATASRRLPLAPLIAASVLVLALTACSGDGGSESEEADDALADGTSSEELSQEELAELVVESPVPDTEPAADLSALPPEPDASAHISDRVAWFLLSSVSERAAHVDPDAVAECPGDMEEAPGLSYTCTLAYGGLDLEFPVGTEDDYGDVAFQFEEPEFPTVREVVEDTIRFQHDVEAVFCDMDDVVAVEPGDDRAPYLCYARDGGVAWVNSPEDTISPYEVHLLVNTAAIITNQHLDVD